MIIKLLICLVSGALLLSAADDKKPEESAPSKTPFTELQKAIFDKTNAQAETLNLKYKIVEYRKELDAIASEQNNVIEEACKAIGVAADKVKSECGYDPTVVDANKKVVGGVFRVPPVPAVKK